MKRFFFNKIKNKLFSSKKPKLNAEQQKAYNERKVKSLDNESKIRSSPVHFFKKELKDKWKKKLEIAKLISKKNKLKKHDYLLAKAEINYLMSKEVLNQIEKKFIGTEGRYNLKEFVDDIYNKLFYKYVTLTECRPIEMKKEAYVKFSNAMGKLCLDLISSYEILEERKPEPRHKYFEKEFFRIVEPGFGITDAWRESIYNVIHDHHSQNNLSSIHLPIKNKN